jgi:hypothetical protein
MYAGFAVHDITISLESPNAMPDPIDQVEAGAAALLQGLG